MMLLLLPDSEKEAALMNRERSLRGGIVYVSLAVLILVGFFLSVGIGNVHIGFTEVLRAITG